MFTDIMGCTSVGGRPVSLLAHAAGYRRWRNHKHDITRSNQSPRL